MIRAFARLDDAGIRADSGLGMGVRRGSAALRVEWRATWAGRAAPGADAAVALPTEARHVSVVPCRAPLVLLACPVGSEEDSPYPQGSL